MIASPLPRGCDGSRCAREGAMKWHRQASRRGGFGMGRFRWVMVMAAGLLAAGCSDDGLLTPGPLPGAPEGPGEPSEDATSVGPYTRRVDLDFVPAGAFRPGLPVTITAIARGRRTAQ